jgi:predicted acylesterase/phospholipase RssA
MQTSYPTIKHLILCGGGPSIFRTIGALHYLEDQHFWNINNIETIYATSAGAIFGAMICLKFDHETIEKYLIHRPWKEVFPIKMSQIMDIYSKKGLYDHNVAEIIFKPLLYAKDLTLTITLKELFEFSKIELHMYSLEINEFKTVDISYKTHPDLPLLHALIMTSAIPTLFMPFCKDNGCYIDGGVTANYPLNFCLADGHKKEEILGLRFLYEKHSANSHANSNTNANEQPLETLSQATPCDNDTGNNNNNIKNVNNIINQQSNILDFLMGLFGKIISQIGTETKQENIPYEIYCKTTHMSFETLKSALWFSSTRQELLDSGAKFGEQFLSSLSSLSSSSSLSSLKKTIA